MAKDNKKATKPANQEAETTLEVTEETKIETAPAEEVTPAEEPAPENENNGPVSSEEIPFKPVTDESEKLKTKQSRIIGYGYVNCWNGMEY